MSMGELTAGRPPNTGPTPDNALGQCFALLTNTLIEQSVYVHADEAYIHCLKHSPKPATRDKDVHLATDNKQLKSDRFNLD